MSVQDADVAVEAQAYLAAVDMFRAECPGRVETDTSGRPRTVAAGPSWRSEADELEPVEIALRDAARRAALRAAREAVGDPGDENVRGRCGA